MISSNNIPSNKHIVWTITGRTIDVESASTKTRIKFIDDNGVTYMLETTLPLQELIKVAEFLR